ncbi:lytic polysaccharide monooxygenase [Pseudomonas sp.]|uniref:lytic polysaccharide monooxygenase n=1 Tax=Pseudomonas sp. TaxID=306 RepID=UPI001B06B43F|nr:lytic polysaccharide monooxygenase [Pseudomonas sp.]MBO9548384.1 lytic polysaccharide monooxygenase [Pseudomonas sp.]
MSSKKPGSTRDPHAISWKVAPRHGVVASPKSRAYFADEKGLIEGNLKYGIEWGKFFPAVVGGLQDPYAATDATNITPPVDGKIASGERPGAAYLDRTDVNWQKHKVYGGEALDFVWEFSARHKYRRFNYFITRVGWDPDQPLSRAQFEAEPFATFLNTRQPYWSYTDVEMWPANPTTHTLTLPKREGYYVLLGVWEVAETDKAFYQVVDLEFLPDGEGPEGPGAPYELHDMGTTETSVDLMWAAPENGAPVDGYIIYRDGNEVGRVPSLQRTFTDDNLKPDTSYRYTVKAFDAEGQLSPSSNVHSARTKPGEGGGEYRDWKLKDSYSTGEIVRHDQLLWQCLTSHTAHVESWAPGAADGFTLWKEYVRRR